MAEAAVAVAVPVSAVTDTAVSCKTALLKLPVMKVFYNNLPRL